MKKGILPALTIVSILLLFYPTFASANVTNIQPQMETYPENDRYLFQLSNMKPGDWSEKDLTIQNRGEQAFKYTMKDSFIGGSKKLYNEFNLEVKAPDGTVLYSGKLKDFGQLEPRTLSAMHEEVLHLKVEFPYELGNEFQGKEFSVEFIFTAELTGNVSPVTGDPIDTDKPPGDGDILPNTSTNYYNVAALGLLFIIGAGTVWLIAKKKKQV